MSAERVTFLDSSAIVKLVVRERESAALARYLRRKRPLVASALARVEVVRAAGLAGADVAHRAREVLARLALVRINERVLAEAATMRPLELRSFDAIHLATAALFGDTLSRVVTYDERMAEAARGLGMNVVAP